MLFLPSSSLPPKHSTTGIARGRAASGHWLRAKTIPLNPRSNAQSVWRQVFRAAKLNWQSMGVGGANNAPVYDIDPQSAWAIQAADYFGILEAGLLQGNIQGQGILVGCATAEAFQTMCQATMATLNQAMLPAPDIVTAYLAYPGSPFSGTEGNFTLGITGPTTPSPTTPAIQLVLTFTTTAQSAPPTGLSASATNCTCTVSALTETQAPGPVVTNVPCSVIANGTDWVYEFTTGITPGELGTFTLTTTGFATSAFNVTNAAAAQIDATQFAIANTTLNGTNQSGGLATIENVGPYQWVATVTVEPSNALTAGTLTLTIQFTDATGTHTVNLSLAATTGDQTPSLPPPTFAFPNNLSCGTVYNLSYQVTGFALTYSYVGTLIYPMSRDGAPLAGVWLITASPAYTSSYSPPSASSWQPILVSGPNMPAASSILAAWIEVFGALPDSGDIKFQAQYADTVTGCVGPALSCTASWQVGTLESYDSAAWTGPIFGINNDGPSPTVTAPGSASLVVNVFGANSYAGTITLTVKSKVIVGTGSNSTAKALPAGVAFSLSLETITIASGDTSQHPTTLTITAASGAQQFSGGIYVEATDGISTHSTSIDLVVTGDVVAQPPANFLGLDPGQVNLYVAFPSTNNTTLALYNSGPEDIGAVMIAETDDPDLTISFDPVSVVVPAGTTESPGAASTVLTVVAAASATQPLGLEQLEASAGAYTTNNILNTAASQYGGIALAPFAPFVGNTNPSTVHVTFTVTSALETATTVTLSITGVPTGCTASFATGTVSCAPGSTNSPSSATDVLTVTIGAGAAEFPPPFTVTATGGGFTVSTQVAFA